MQHWVVMWRSCWIYFQSTCIGTQVQIYIWIRLLLLLICVITRRIFYYFCVAGTATDINANHSVGLINSTESCSSTGAPLRILPSWQCYTKVLHKEDIMTRIWTFSRSLNVKVNVIWNVFQLYVQYCRRQIH